MKVSNLIYIASKNSWRSKLNILSLILNITVLIFILFALSMNDSIEEYWKNTIRKSIDYRTLLVNYDTDKYNYDEAKKKLNDFKNVETVQDFSSYLITMQANDYINPKKENAFFLAGATDKPIKISKGNDLSQYEDNEKVLICPNKFYPYFEEKIEDIQNNNAIDFTDNINKNLSLSFIGSNEKIYFKLVGLYDVEENNSPGNTCYTKWKNVEYLNLKYQPDVYEITETQIPPFVVVVNDVSNVKKFESSIAEKGFISSGPVVKVNTDMGDNILNMVVAITKLVVLIFIIILLLFNFYQIRKRRKVLAIMKVAGYSNKNLFQLSFVEENIKGLLSFIIAVPLCYCIPIIANNFIMKRYASLNGLNINIEFSNLILLFVFTLIFSALFSLLINYKIKKINIVDMK